MTNLHTSIVDSQELGSGWSGLMRQDRRLCYPIFALEKLLTFLIDSKSHNRFKIWPPDMLC